MFRTLRFRSSGSAIVFEPERINTIQISPSFEQKEIRASTKIERHNIGNKYYVHEWWIQVAYGFMNLSRERLWIPLVNGITLELVSL